MDLISFEIIPVLLGSNLIVAIVTIFITKILNRKSDYLDIVEKQKKQYQDYIKTLEAKLENLSKMMDASMASGERERKEREKLTMEVSKLKDKIVELIKQGKKDKILIEAWGEESMKKDVIIKEKNNIIAELINEIDISKKE